MPCLREAYPPDCARAETGGLTVAEYIERTEELVLAMNAGARAIENTKRYHGAVYTKDLFSDNSQKIPYLQAAKVLRGVEDAPTVDAVVVTRCKDCKHKGWVQEPCHGKSVDYCKVWDCTLRDLESTFCSYGERKDGGADHEAD